MRILVHGINYAPENIGVGKFTSEMCTSLTLRGHSIQIVTAPPYYPMWSVPVPYSGVRYKTEIIDGVTVSRCPLYVPRKPTGLRRLIHHASFAISSAPIVIHIVKRFKPDVVFAVVPSILSAPVAILAAKIAGASSWLHVQDFEIDAAFELGLLSSEKLRYLALLQERRILRSFDRVSSISPRMVAKLIEKGGDPAQTIEFRNWVDTSFITPSDRMTSHRAILGIDERTIVALYSGNMAAKQGVEYLADAARRLATIANNVLVLLCGAGPMRAHLEMAVAGLPNVRFLDLQPAARLSELLATADIHLLPQRLEATDLVLPSKLGGMLASGRPIVAMAVAGSGLASEIEGAGIAVSPGDGEAFAQAIVALAGDSETRARLGATARKSALARWDKYAIINRLEANLFALTSTQRMPKCCK
jgi:colanic acid biosynthesis glycosyl transferase WcaI